MLLAGRTPPARWPVRLPDLASRLRAITAVQIGPPEDALLRALLARLLADRQIRLPNSRCWTGCCCGCRARAAALREAVGRLDDASLEQHRDITVPFARDVLAELMAAAPDEISGTARPLAG